MAKQPPPSKPTEKWPPRKSGGPSAVQPTKFVLRLKNDEGQETTIGEFMEKNPGYKPVGIRPRKK